jgi:hypothetical protein
MLGGVWYGHKMGSIIAYFSHIGFLFIALNCWVKWSS